jgi:hypothetical protein
MKREFVSSKSVIGLLTTTMNTLETVEDWLLHHLLTDATSLFRKLSTSQWVQLQQDQQVQVKPKQQKI